MSETVTIGGREFRVGATYRPKFGEGKPRTILKLDARYRYGDFGPMVLFTPGSFGREQSAISYAGWARWAGVEVQP